MTKWGVHDGDLVWVNPEQTRLSGLNRPVFARLLDEQGDDQGLVVKVLKMDEQGNEHLRSDGVDGDTTTRFYSSEFIAPCVWLQPKGRTLLREIPERVEWGGAELEDRPF